eukprot:CAMPEP_0196779682 /NCGR_PEP_ID=MMETSP1104-20130614/6526_1 /TAXON_ID=33652 /ORGANISM="Cafeteria sp., Strain Caron Lab Isolate" /LENGTH=366 /DNA_ID=CAMNT_0042149865 /DNA_START=1 /DNA_END=1101 /DNA_ORIENTATION=-
MRSSVLLALGLAALLLLSVPCDAKRRRGSKSKSKRRRKSVEEIEIDASGGVEDLGGFASAPSSAPASSSGGGRDMSAEFAKYKDCQACTGAGWGWCPIRRRCGGFANKNCRGDETDFAEGHEPAQFETTAGGDVLDVTAWRNTEETTRLWEVISSGDEKELERLLDENAARARLRSEDGRGPLFWAHEYGQEAMVELLVRHGADAEAEDVGGKKPAQMSSSAPRKRTPKPTEPPAGQDMSTFFKSIKTCQACVHEHGYGWCPIRRMCGGFANRDCRGDVTDFVVGHEPEELKEEDDEDDDVLGGFASAPPKKKPSGGGQDMRSMFAKLKTCQECIDAGYGWCPIRRHCGGFANKKCRGDETDLKAE